MKIIELPVKHFKRHQDAVRYAKELKADRWSVRVYRRAERAPWSVSAWKRN